MQSNGQTAASTTEFKIPDVFMRFQMEYKFICPECNKQVVVSMPITEYKPNGHYCDCGVELKRDVKDFLHVKSEEH